MPAKTPAKPSTHARKTPAPIETFGQLRTLTDLFDGDGAMRSTDTEDDAQHDNTRRAGNAAHILAEYGDRTGQRKPGADGVDMFELMRDVLIDLRHLADATGQNFDRVATAARNAYRDDTLGQ